ncbi:group III truncated hemoglobin [Flavobacterium sp. AED]|uniref:group III truncated hemoglobin n=1 Tax=Flavobacterium sp. AED TaxID=1423323 RepID=UPI00057EF5F8|nr:group III truncated hemoglobin [Flavobacterium sp. AED]KIA87251.1 globin [Flavobacterium sp. AED]MDI1307308.1 group III truncated hemoglobin [bacterium]
MKKIIENRDDLTLLVHSFYAKIRADKEIGFFFNETITNWEEHLEKLTDFWEMNLFAIKKYNGNPIAVHNEVDKHFDHRISPNEFGIWLNLWFETLDELFEGENVEILKRRARKMGTFLYMNIFESRSKV